MKLSTVIGLALSLGTAIPSTVSARIGETLDQCQVRYGVMVRVESRVRPDYPQYCFQKGNVEIRVRLYNGFSAQETFLPLRDKLTAGQIEEIQQSNSQAATGKEVIQEVRKDHNTHSNHVVITTTEFHKVFGQDRGSGF
jgi:hypothetical protein